MVLLWLYIRGFQSPTFCLGSATSRQDGGNVSRLHHSLFQQFSSRFLIPQMEKVSISLSHAWSQLAYVLVGSLVQSKPLLVSEICFSCLQIQHKTSVDNKDLSTYIVDNILSYGKFSLSVSCYYEFHRLQFNVTAECKSPHLLENHLFWPCSKLS